jgi:hypothetical protein
MNDWRRARQTDRHFDRLGEYLGRNLVITCAECNLRREFAVRELLALYGADYRMVYLRYEIVGCPAGKQFKDCGVRYVNSERWAE